jgi:hypothetical protein
MGKLFLGKVIQVYPQRTKDTNNNSINVTRDAYSIDVEPAVGRLPLRGVRVLSPIASATSGFVWLPNIDDWVVCGYLEDYPDYAICFGVIKHPLYNQVLEDADQYQDCTLSHQSGSYIRMRDLEKGTNQSSTKSRSEIKLHHKNGSEIVLTEPTEGNGEIQITHSSGTQIKILSDGSLNITANKTTTIIGKDINVNAKNVTLTDQSTIIGDANTATGIHTQLTHPVCFFTGAPLNGSPTNKAS